MNILIATISPLKGSNTNPPASYTPQIPGCKIPVIQAHHTNESIIKCFSEMEAIKASGGIHKVIALVSHLVRDEKQESFGKQTALVYYTGVAKSLGDIHIDTVETETEDGEAREISAMLKDICDRIQIDDTVYIDIAGGQRNISNLIQQLVSILRYKDIKNPCNLYADFGRGIIVDTSESVRMEALLEGFYEFMTTGKVKRISTCFSGTQQGTVKDILSSMTEFSDKVSLGKVEDLEQTVKKLQDSITAYESTNKNDSSIEGVILEQFLPLIKQRMIGRSVEVEYVRIIQWCLDNDLIQQALTIFVEKVPKHVFKIGAIQIKGDLSAEEKKYQESVKKAKSSEWDVVVFYTIFLTDPKADSTLVSLKNGLSKNTVSDNEQVNALVRNIKRLKNSWPRSDSKNRSMKRIVEFIGNQRIKSYDGFINTVLSGTIDQLLRDVLQESGVRPEDTTAKKFAAVESIKNGNVNPSFRLMRQTEKIVRLCYGYLYVKSMRNLSNHASTDENLNEEQKEILASYGYDFSRSDLQTVKKNIQTALDAVKALSLTYISVKKPKAKEEDAVIIQTTLKVGDKVLAHCIGRKTVRIKDHNYDIQLVLVKGDDPDRYIDSEFTVVIKQISGKGKVCQVELPLSEQDEEE